MVTGATRYRAQGHIRSGSLPQSFATSRPGADTAASLALVSWDADGPLRPAGDRSQVAGRMGARRRFHRSQPVSRGRTPSSTRTCSRCSRTRRASCTWAMCSTTRSETSSRTSAAGGASPSCGRSGYDAFGLPAENAAIREGGHPRDVTNRNIAAIREQMKRLGWSIDWSRELSTAEPELLPLDAVALPQVLRGGARVSQGGGGQLVPERPDRPRERAGDRRPLRALRLRGRGAQLWSSGSSASPPMRTGFSTTWSCSSPGRSAC